MKYLRLLKNSPVFTLVLLFYLCAGIFACVYHGFTGSFRSVTGTLPEASAVTSTVVGQIFFPSDDEEEASGEESSGTVLTAGTTETEETEGSPSIDGGLNTAAADVHYYRFVTTTRIQRLHLRTGPSLTAEIIGRLPKGTTGWIISPGTDWSYLSTDDGQRGYCFNGYLELTEVAPEEYPEELKGVTPP